MLTFHCKVEEYLLSETHAIGKSKAKFFRSLGFDEATADKLQQGLLDIAQTGWVKEQIKYTLWSKICD